MDTRATIQQFLLFLAIQDSIQLTEAQPARTVRTATVAIPMAQLLNALSERIVQTG